MGHPIHLPKDDDKKEGTDNKIGHLPESALQVYKAENDQGHRVAIYGFSESNSGVSGESVTSHGVHGLSQQDVGVYGESMGDGTTSIGVLGKGKTLAARFEGVVEVTEDIRLTNAADCAEEFDVQDPRAAEPGTVVVLTGEGPLRPSNRAYDKRVAGVISGAGSYKPGLVLDKQSRDGRRPVALLGKTYCKVDASYGAIEVGDLLTTSPTPGHAMLAVDPQQSFGAVLGKALRPVQRGQDLIPILIALQ